MVKCRINSWKTCQRTISRIVIMSLPVEKRMHHMWESRFLILPKFYRCLYIKILCLIAKNVKNVSGNNINTSFLSITIICMCRSVHVWINKEDLTQCFAKCFAYIDMMISASVMFTTWSWVMRFPSLWQNLL